MGAATIDKTHHLASGLQDQKTLRVLRNTRGDLLQRRGFVALIGADFDIKATGGVGGHGVAEGEGGHGFS
jgi:hypothetical protein